MSNYPSGNAPPYQPNPNLPANPTDTKGADGPAGGDTIRLVQPTTSFPSSPAQSGGSDSMPAAEANYWKSRQDAYADPYDTPDQAPTDGQGQGYGQSPYQVPAGANSEPTIGPWDSASQRSNSVRTTGAGAYGRTGVAGASAPGGMAAGAGGLSGIDEERGYGNPGYGGQRQSQYGYTNMGPGGKDDPYAQAEEYEMRGLVSNAAAMGRTLDNTRGAYGAGGGRTDSYGDPTSNGKYPINTSDSPYAWPPLDNVSGAPHLVKESALTSVLLFPTGLDRLLALVGMNKGSFPIEQQIERKRHGVPGQRFPVATWVLTAVMTGVMIYELIRNNALTGSVIATKPTFNYMIGPSSSVLINIGARFPPCMKLVEAVPPTFNFACISDLNNPPTTVCPIAEICGHGLTTTGTPDQWWRFIVPIFLHVGVVHLLVNMVAQMLIGAQIEKEIGTLPYLIVYFAGGVYGFLLGGNFGRVGVPSAGASGALFAVNACVAVDLALHWKYEERPVLKAFFVFIEFCIGIAIGYIPNAVDGLAHLGGFAMGILLGTILYPSISETKAHRYTLWAARVVALVLVIVAFALTTKNFYTDDPNAACQWCRYLSCFPTSSNDYCKGTGLTQTTV